jgi:Xaa-Pro aminopeptidase
VEVTSRDLAVRYNLDRMNDPWDGLASREARFIAKMRERFPTLAFHDLTPALDGMRLIKSPQEIAVLRRSSELASVSLMEAMRSTMPGQYEYELAWLMRFVHGRNGAQGEAYYPLVANGTNAFAPHYHAALSQLKAGDLLLVDSAPDYHYYESDVTRMWPVNGKFTAQQRELYGFYLGCYRAIMSHIRPNVSPRTVGQEAQRDMEALLAKSKFTNPNHAKAAAKFVSDYKARTESTNPFSLGHWVGMSTHDVGGPTDMLKPGMVFTIEPALTVPEDETYIRLEDMLLITDTGVENMSPQAPEDPDAIEKLMQEKGILKQFPRIMADDAVIAK